MKKSHARNGKKGNILFLYVALLLPIFIIIAFAWYFLVDGILYYCGDKVPFLDLIPPFVHGTNFGDYFIVAPTIVYLTWLVTLVSLFLSPWILLKNAFINRMSYVKIFLLAISVPILLFVAVFIYGMSISTSLPPSAPPNWDSPSAVYMIGKKHQNYVVHYEIDGNIGDYFVGISKIDLAPFIERKVIIKGNFPKKYSDLMERATDTQCIQGVCHQIFTPKFWEGKYQITPVIDIDNLQVVTEARPRDRVIEYITTNDDTLTSVAQKFSVTTNSIEWLNNRKIERIEIGENLKIPPVTGVVHKVLNGETISSIAKKYQVDTKKIIDYPYNSYSDDKFTLVPGQILIVPDGIGNIN